MKNNSDISKFSIWVSALTLLLVVFSFIITLFEPFNGYLAFLLWSIAIFFIIIWVTYLLGAWFSYKNDEKRFLGLAYVNFLVKLVIVVIIPLYYRSMFDPPDSNYIIPYIVIYAVFTIAETYFLSGKIRFRR
ncbi:MAG TPA: hypothetical protein PKD85_00810 [Saprospiraceae bacterium]|nr:hypothetical protein [Saprospiraceae bacterium]